MLRTGQMRLPVRTAKPVELQYKAPVAEVITELTREPEIGKIYMYKGRKVECVARGGCRDCIRPCATRDGVFCSLSVRADGKSVQFLPVD